jgi:hypothetical protein
MFTFSAFPIGGQVGWIKRKICTPKYPIQGKQNQRGGGVMHMSEVKERAGACGVKPGKLGKIDLIRAIQNTEGNSPCFQTGLSACDQYNCCWRDDCLPGGGNENHRETFLNKIKVELKEFNEKMDSLKMRADTMVGKRKAEALNDIKRLEKKYEDEIKLNMHKLAAASEDIWQSTKKSIDASWKELKKASQETRSRFGGTKPKDPNPPL